MTTQLQIPDNYLGKIIERSPEGPYCCINLGIKLSILEYLRTLGETMFEDVSVQEKTVTNPYDTLELSSMGVAGNLRVSRSADITIHCQEVSYLNYQLVIQSPDGNQALTDQISAELSTNLDFGNRTIFYDCSMLY